MSTSITLDEGQMNLRDLIGRLEPGDEIVGLDHEKPVARIMAPSPRKGNLAP